MTRSYGMTMEDLEEALSDILPPGFEIKVVKGKIVIATNLVENSYGDLLVLEEDEDDDEDSDLDLSEEDYLGDDVIDDE